MRGKPSAVSGNSSPSQAGSCLYAGLAVILLICLTSTSCALLTTHFTLSIRTRYRNSKLIKCQVKQEALQQTDIPRISNLAADVLFWVDFARQDMANQGMTVSDKCNFSLGAGFLERLASSSGTVCGSSHGTASWVDCFGYPVKKQGLGCVANNLVLDGCNFMGQGPAAGAAAHGSYIPAGRAGSVRLGCSINSSSPPLVVSNLQNEQLPWLKSALTEADPAEISSNCSRHGPGRVGHPAVFVSRLDTTNPYHHTQSVIQTFLTLVAAGKSDATNRFKDIQVIIADHFSEGPYMELWRRLSHPHPVIHLANSSTGGVCYNKAVLAHYATPANAFLGYEGVDKEYPCFSPLLLAASHWLRYLFLNGVATMQPQPLSDDQAYKHAGKVLSAPTGHQRLNVVFISRSWFERSMMAGGGLTGWQQQRAMVPDQENTLTQALQQAVQEWNMRACVPPTFGWWQEHRPRSHQGDCRPTNVTFEFQVAELSLMELYPSQVLMFSKTAVLVAAHGAALTNMIFMRPHRGAIVELWYGNYHYVNQAHMLGHKHFRTGSQPDFVVSALWEAMKHVASKY